jgi:mRNA interferase MazF
VATEQIAVRLPRQLLEQVDQLVACGVYESRAAAVRAGLEAVAESERRRRIDRAVIEGYRRDPARDAEREAAVGSMRDAIVEEPVVSEPRRGEVWWGEIADVGRRPFLVMARAAAIPVLHNLLAAPITRTVRDIPTEVGLGPDDGMPTECAASFDNLRVVPKAYLVEQICALDTVRMLEACRALRAAVDC